MRMECEIDWAVSSAARGDAAAAAAAAVLFVVVVGEEGDAAKERPPPPPPAPNAMLRFAERGDEEDAFALMFAEPPTADDGAPPAVTADGKKGKATSKWRRAAS